LPNTTPQPFGLIVVHSCNAGAEDLSPPAHFRASDFLPCNPDIHRCRSIRLRHFAPA
jgi:hypothetical protein